MGGIIPEKYQDYVRGKISYAEATGQKDAGDTYFGGKKSSSGSTNSSPPSIPSSTYSPPPSFSSPAPSYTKPSTPAYMAPVSSTYSGPASVIGNVSGSNDVNKSYQSIYDSVRAADPSRNQINTFSDNSGNVYDTTKMTPQQIYALDLNKNHNPDAAKILDGMGLDVNGNPLNPTYAAIYAKNNASGLSPEVAAKYSYPYPPSGNMTTSDGLPPGAMNIRGPSSTPSYTKNPTVDAMPIDQQLAYYKEHPQEAQQEIKRAQDVYSQTGAANANTWANQLQAAIGTTFTPAGSGNGGGSSTGAPAGGGQGAAGNGSNVGGTTQVAYSPPPSSTPMMSADDITSRVTANVNDEIARQIQAYNQQVAQGQQANNAAVTQNNSALDDQLAKLRESQVMDEQDAQTLQNRRGGFYSGGLDYQLGSIDRSYANNQGNLRRDTQQRNAALWSNNAQLAQQAAEKIAMLQQQAPDKIRQLVTEELQRARDNARQDASLTGVFNGAPTMAAQNQQFNQDRAVTNDRAANTGVYLPVDAQRLITGILDLKRQAESGQIDPASAKQQADTMRSQLSMMGVDPGVVSYDDNYQTAIQKVMSSVLGSPTLDAQKLEHTISQDKAQNDLTQQKITQDAEQFAASMGYNWAKLTQDQKQFLMTLAVQQQNADTSAKNAQTNADQASWDRDPNNPKNNKPPAGSFNLDDYKGQINSRFYKADSYGNKTFDAKAAEAYILSLYNSGQIDANGAKQLYSYYQIPTN